MFSHVFPTFPFSNIFQRFDLFWGCYGSAWHGLVKMSSWYSPFVFVKYCHVIPFLDLTSSWFFKVTFSSINSRSLSPKRGHLTTSNGSLWRSWRLMLFCQIQKMWIISGHWFIDLVYGCLISLFSIVVGVSLATMPQDCWQSCAKELDLQGWCGAHPCSPSMGWESRLG